jgi:hypothetical protein
MTAAVCLAAANGGALMSTVVAPHADAQDDEARLREIRAASTYDASRLLVVNRREKRER